MARLGIWTYRYVPFKAEFHPKVELLLNPLLAPLHATFGMSFYLGGGEWGLQEEWDFLSHFLLPPRGFWQLLL